LVIQDIGFGEMALKKIGFWEKVFGKLIFRNLVIGKMDIQEKMWKNRFLEIWFEISGVYL